MPRNITFTYTPFPLFIRVAGERSNRREDSLATYTDVNKIFTEVEDVEKFYKQKKITRVDVTGKSVQATAKKILQILHQRYSEFSTENELPSMQASFGVDMGMRIFVCDASTLAPPFSNVDK